MQVTFSRSVVGSLALLEALVAGCSSHAAMHHNPPRAHHSAAATSGGGGGMPQNQGQAGRDGGSDG